MVPYKRSPPFQAPFQAQGYGSFFQAELQQKTNASHGDPRVGWLSTPSQRGTIDIIWGCTLVLFLCIWTVLHLNIPAKTDGYWTRSARKIRWSVFAIIYPELISLFASMQWSSARLSVKEMRALGGSQWTLTHAFFANSGGLVLKTRGMRQSFPISAKSVHYLPVKKRLELPNMTKEEIWDKSKSDKFAKWVAFIQGAWLVLQCIGRAVQNLAVTPFEVFTIAYMVCTVATSYFWYHKPQDVEIPVVIEVDWTVTELHLAERGSALRPWVHTPMDFLDKELQGLWERRPSLYCFGGLTRPLNREPNDGALVPPDLSLALWMWGLTMLYCGIHVSGWNFDFATIVELWIWRTPCLIMLFAAIGAGLANVISTSPRFDFGLSLIWIWVRRTSSQPTLLQKRLIDIPVSVVTASYIVARLCLMVETLYSMHSLPSTAYQTVDWTAFLPHV